MKSTSRIINRFLAKTKYCPITTFPTLSAATIPKHSQNLPAPGGQSSLYVRSFHLTSLTQFPVRRRRRGRAKPSTNDDDSSTPPENLLKPEAVFNTDQFIHASMDLLDKIEKALEPMKDKNEIFIVSKEVGILTINLGPKEGSYRIEINEEECMFEYTSPISGKLLYVLCSDTGEWVGVEDGHLFEGVLVRDLIRQCQGLPNL